MEPQIHRKGDCSPGAPILDSAPRSAATSSGRRSGDQLKQVLLRVEDEAQVGWKCMPLQEFLASIDLASWKDGQQLVGMILPQDRRQTLH